MKQIYCCLRQKQCLDQRVEVEDAGWGTLIVHASCQYKTSTRQTADGIVDILLVHTYSGTGRIRDTTSNGGVEPSGLPGQEAVWTGPDSRELQYALSSCSSELAPFVLSLI
jgi:hypothetical protein